MYTISLVEIIIELRYLLKFVVCFSNRKIRLFHKTVLVLIRKFENGQLFSCEEVLIHEIDRYFILRNSLEIKNLNESDFTHHACLVIFNFSFDILSSGKLHFHRGELKKEGYSLLKVCEKAMDFAVISNWMTEEEKKENLSVLYYNIAQVG